MATRGLAIYLWSREAKPGQSPTEIGRSMVLGEIPGPSYDRAWMAEDAGQVVGMLLGYRREELVDPATVPAEVKAVVELENLALGHWLVNLLAGYPQYRGLGIGTMLLAFAEEQARATSSKGMSLIVESDNDGARRLYERTGYAAADRRPIAPFPGSPPGGEFILMTKPFR